MSLELLPGNAAVVVAAGMMGLLVGGAVGLEQCWGMLGETGSTLTMAGAELRQTGGDKTTVGEDRQGGCWLNSPNRKKRPRSSSRSSLPGLVWSMEGRPCRMRVLAGAGDWGTGRVVTHTGLGWMGGLLLRIVLAFKVAELGRTAGEKNKRLSSCTSCSQPERANQSGSSRQHNK